LIIDDNFISARPPADKRVKKPAHQKGQQGKVTSGSRTKGSSHDAAGIPGEQSKSRTSLRYWTSVTGERKGFLKVCGDGKKNTPREKNHPDPAVLPWGEEKGRKSGSLKSVLAARVQASKWGGRRREALIREPGDGGQYRYSFTKIRTTTNRENREKGKGGGNSETFTVQLLKSPGERREDDTSPTKHQGSEG